MPAPHPGETAAGAAPRRLFFYNAGFAVQPRLRRILALAGHELRLGLPGPGDGVAVWGRSPRARRGEAVAAWRGVPLVRVEDAFLRSVHPGRSRRDGPLGLLVDPLGVHFDGAVPSALERLLATHPLDDARLLARARDGIARIAALDLSKYNAHDPDRAVPAPGYVLVVDQTRGDAAIAGGGATAATFGAMLAAARADHPGARIVVKVHPETAAGLRPGHFGPADAQAGATLLADPVSPWRLLAGAVAVYAVSSQLGWEAVLAGHRPVLFGRPWYAGWGLTEDRAHPCPRRARRLTRAQTFAAAMILAPLWHDPCRDRLCTFEEAVDQLEAEVRAFRQDRAGHVAAGMRLWKRPHLQAMFGGEGRLVFRRTTAGAAALARRTGRGLLVWGDAAVPAGAAPLRLEDGFLRSRGLGAALVPPLSLVADDLGLHCDPARPSRLETLIAAPLPPGGRARAERLVARIVAGGLTKYNLHGGAAGAAGAGDGCAGAVPRRILVAGQVEDDASIRLGATGPVRTNLDLLRAVRAANPGARLIWKPHPDVEAGLRPGRVDPADLAGLADATAPQADPAALFPQVDEVWTITSLLGFEALLRGLPVTCLGAPFYAGWGLTTDLAPVPGRRRRAADGHPLPRPDTVALAHAALIACPRYRDPVSGRPCPPEVALDRLADGGRSADGPANRLMAKAQGLLAGRARLWRGR